jgi:hypothetical protein
MNEDKRRSTKGRRERISVRYLRTTADRTACANWVIDLLEKGVITPEEE